MRLINPRIQLLTLFLIFSIFSCEQTSTDYQKAASNPKLLHSSLLQLTDVIVHDIFSPPVASRIYAYPSIAAYEVLRNDHKEYKSLAGQLNGLAPAPLPSDDEEYSFPLASVKAFLEVGKTLIFSVDKMEEFEKEVLLQYKKMGMSSSTYNRSIEYGELVAKHILDWADKDKYKETRTYPKYTFDDQPHTWKPTPPGYMEGIEPSWNKIRPFVIDSSNQFVPEPPTAFDMSKNSKFFKELMEVYETVKTLNEERTEIASFWDCNPYVSHQTGHVMYATKKITPGGHWMGIAYIAATKSNADLMKSVETYALTSIALADAFISCWDEKWRSLLIRPETVINEHLDQDWAPLLQTPPFPEHTSGHSVISTAASVALTNLYGDNFSFVDSTELAYGLPARTFKSFSHAAEEAAISRLYGGIHYMPAITEGVKQGKQVGEFVVANLITRE